MFVYLLHFDDPLSHAQHYLGICDDLKNRLTEHASGWGSAICRELISSGRIFRLGAIGNVTRAAARRTERRMKDGHNLPQYCEICQGSNAKRMPETTPISIELIPFDGSRLAKQNPFTNIEITNATTDQLSWIKSEMKTGKTELGFLPEPSLKEAINAQRAAIAKIDGENAGYVVRTINHQRSETKIQQCWVTDKHRGKLVGKSLIDYISSQSPAMAITAHVRNDLPANLFWAAIGFELIRRKEHKTSKNILNQYHRPSKISQYLRNYKNV